MSTLKKHKKDTITATILIIAFALALIVILLLPWLANIKSMVDSAFLAPDVFAQLSPQEQAEVYEKSYDNALLLGGAVRQFYLAFALQFFLLLVMAAWARVLLRRYGRATVAAHDAAHPETETAQMPQTAPNAPERTHTPDASADKPRE